MAFYFIVLKTFSLKVLHFLLLSYLWVGRWGPIGGGDGEDGRGDGGGDGCQDDGVVVHAASRMNLVSVVFLSDCRGRATGGEEIQLMNNAEGERVYRGIKVILHSPSFLLL